MAGFVRKGNHIYNGANKAYAALKNGTFVEIGANGVVAITADGDMEMKIVEKTYLWGKKAFVLDVIYEGTKDQYFLENEWCIKDDCTYDTSDYTCAVGDYVKMKRLQVGEQIIMTVGDTEYAALSVGDIAIPSSGGSIEEKA